MKFAGRPYPFQRETGHGSGQMTAKSSPKRDLTRITFFKFLSLPLFASGLKILLSMVRFFGPALLSCGTREPTHRKGGHRSATDVLIASAAISHRCHLSTPDKHFTHIAEHSELELFALRQSRLPGFLRALKAKSLLRSLLKTGGITPLWKRGATCLREVPPCRAKAGRKFSETAVPWTWAGICLTKGFLDHLLLSYGRFSLTNYSRFHIFS